MPVLVNDPHQAARQEQAREQSGDRPVMKQLKQKSIDDIGCRGVNIGMLQIADGPPTQPFDQVDIEELIIIPV